MLNDVAIRNATRISATRIDCEIQHPVFGWIPYTAAADDVEASGRAIYLAAEALL